MEWFNPHVQAESQRAKIVSALERLSTLFRSGLWELAKQNGLSPLQVQLLMFIGFHAKEHCNVSLLAKEFAVTKATVSDAVKSLSEKKLLKKVMDGTDGRAFSLTLTAGGKKLVGHFSAFSSPAFAALGKTSEEEIAAIWQGLALLVEKLQTDGQIPTRMCFNCRHFGKNHPEGAPHYCHLMQKALRLEEIRIDCPEHQNVATAAL